MQGQGGSEPAGPPGVGPGRDIIGFNVLQAIDTAWRKCSPPGRMVQRRIAARYLRSLP